METVKKPNKPSAGGKKLILALKKHSKLICIIAAAIVLIVAAITIPSAIKANQVKTQLENKIFITDAYNDGSWIDIYAFKSGKIAAETWYLDSLETSGDIANFNTKYRIVASIFDDKIEIQSKYPHGWIKTVTVYLDNAGVVQYYKYTDAMPDWHETTLETVLNLRAEKMCDHNFGKAIVTKAATCTEPGEEKQVCQKCGFEQKKSVYVQHDYVNGVCSICGAKKAAENAEIKPNTWYTYDNTVLQIQNCLVKAAISISQGKGMEIQYRAVCQYCHAVDNTIKPAGVEAGSEIEKIHSCGECGKQTLVKFKID